MQAPETRSGLTHPLPLPGAHGSGKGGQGGAGGGKGDSKRGGGVRGGQDGLVPQPRSTTFAEAVSR